MSRKSNRAAKEQKRRLAIVTTWLEHGVWFDRCTACSFAEELPPDLAIPLLLKALKDEVADVHGAAARALGTFGREAASAVPAIVEAFHAAQDGYVRTECIIALGRIAPGAAKVFPVLQEALKDPEDSVRQSAAEALKTFPPATRREDA